MIYSYPCLFYFISDDMTKESIRDAFESAVQDAQRVMGEIFIYELYINLITDRSGEETNYGFLWCSNKSISNLIHGYNISGEKLETPIIKFPEVVKRDGTMGTLYLDVGKVKSCGSSMDPYSLCSYNAPRWITNKMILDLFTPFSEDPKGATIKILRQGSYIQLFYPKGSKDALYALAMCKKLEVRSEPKSAILYFNHSANNK